MTQSDLRRAKLIARALRQLQSISAAVHFESATINIPNNADIEPMTPPTKDMGVDPKLLYTTTKVITDTLYFHHTADYGLLEDNSFSSDVKDDLITSLPSTSPMKHERNPQLQILALQQIAERGFYLPMLSWKLKQQQHQTSFKTTYRQLQDNRFATLTSVEQSAHYQFRSC